MLSFFQVFAHFEDRKDIDNVPLLKYQLGKNKTYGIYSESEDDYLVESDISIFMQKFIEIY